MPLPRYALAGFEPLLRFSHSGCAVPSEEITLVRACAFSKASLCESFGISSA
ncbi:MAG: hypothetical protein QGH90_07540 [Candidatus Poseidoniaceae archaeon]|nr:hypothetical protein [Candidatus Poseidoniaceae archaeon]